MSEKPPVLEDSPYPRPELHQRCRRCESLVEVTTGYCENCGWHRRVIVGVLAFFLLPAIGLIACLIPNQSPLMSAFFGVAGWFVCLGPFVGFVYFAANPRPRKHANWKLVTEDGRCTSCGDPLGDKIRCPRCTPKGVSLVTSLPAIGVPLIGLWMLFSDMSSGAPGSGFGDFAIFLLVFGPIVAFLRYLFVGR